jgi:hypothetical protein
MGLPRWLIGLFDPASREFERDHRRHGHPHPRRGKPFRGGAVMGPGIPGGSRQATVEEMAAMAARADGLHLRRETVLAEVLAEHGEVLRTTARDVLSNGRAQVILGTVTLDAELMSFWRGDRILRIQRTSRSGTSAGSSLARFPRQDRADSEEIIADYLASCLADARMNE